MKDYYYILGLQVNATNEEIKSAYRKLSLKYHPDANNGDKYYEQLFKEIKEAYDILIDESLRSEYDLKRHSFYRNKQLAIVDDDKNTSKLSSWKKIHISKSLNLILTYSLFSLLLFIALLYISKSKNYEVDRQSLILVLDSLKNKLLTKHDSIALLLKENKTNAKFQNYDLGRPLFEAPDSKWLKSKQPANTKLTKKLDTPTTKYLSNNVIIDNAEDIELLNLQWEWDQLKSASVYNKTKDTIQLVTCDFVVKDPEGRPIDSGVLVLTPTASYEKISPNQSKICYAHRTPLKKQENQSAIITIKSWQ